MTGLELILRFNCQCDEGTAVLEHMTGLELTLRFNCHCDEGTLVLEHMTGPLFREFRVYAASPQPAAL